MMLPAINVPGFDRHLFPEGPAALNRENTVIPKEPYLDIGHFKISLRKNTIDYLDLKLTTRGNYQMGAAFLTRVISGRTVPTGSALAF